MNLEECRENYYFYSGKTSDIVRQLALGGLGIIWIFKTDAPDGQLAMPGALLPTAILIVAGLILDLFQYAYAAGAWGIYHRHLEKQGTAPESSIEAPQEINWPTITFYCLKVLSILLAYVNLIGYLISKLKWGS